MVYDLLVIGSGPGGYVAAIRGAQLGYKVGLIEKHLVPGGTCLNVGCIPSKSLLESTHLFESVHTKGQQFGVEVEGLRADWGKMMDRKNQVIAQSQKGLQFLFKKNNIDWIYGEAKLLSAGEVEVSGEETSRLQTKKILIATGSKPVELPFAKFDHQQVLSSTDVLSLTSIPESLVVIGGGVIGLEMGSIFNRLGSAVTVVELTDSLLPEMDTDLSKELLRCLKKQKFKFKLKHQLTSLKPTDAGVEVQMLDSKDKTSSLTAEKVLVAVGRRPNTKGLGLDKLGVTLDPKGYIQVNNDFETHVPGIFAVGDVIGGQMLAHKASEEGVWAVDTMAGHSPKRSVVPAAVYTHPEVASVGLSESELKSSDTAFTSGKFNFRPLGRALAAGSPDGFVKVLSDPQTGQILGVHLIGERATDLVATASVAISQKMTAAELGQLCFAHPSYAEALKEASLDAWNHQSIHQ